MSTIVIPAQAGIQPNRHLDSSLRWNDTNKGKSRTGCPSQPCLSAEALAKGEASEASPIAKRSSAEQGQT
ncbi:MAG: hypothetical protein K2Q12_07175 [Rickettsiales bacterium]|nr:hypothetical protein [Rickettsiales bacterium]